MLDTNNLKDKKTSDLKFFYNNTLFKDLVDHKKHTQLKKLFTYVENKSFDGSTISNASSRSNSKKKRGGSNIIMDRHRLVRFV